VEQNLSEINLKSRGNYGFFSFLFPNQYIAPAITQSNIPLIGANGSIEEYPSKFDGLPGAGTKVEIPTTTKMAMTSQ
jgi:hypothetical protein